MGDSTGGPDNSGLFSTPVSPFSPQDSSSGGTQVCTMDPNVQLETTLNVLQSEAGSFGARFINDAQVRNSYVRATRQFADETLNAVKQGQISAYEGARLANDMRNELMELSRLKSSDIGRASAESLKSTGLTLQQLLEKYAQKLYRKPYAQLAAAEQNAVALEIIKSSGRANPKVTASAQRLGAVGKAFWVLTAAVAVYSVATAENKVEEGARQSVTLGGGWAGGAAGGAVAGLACGPGAPVCVTIGVFAGAALGAIGADLAFDYVQQKARDVASELNGIRPAWGFPGKRPFCFAAGTPILTLEGLHPIEQICRGDTVWAFDPESRQFVTTVVLETDHHYGRFDLLSIETHGGDTIQVTTGHWFMGGKEWVISERLANGHVLTSRWGNQLITAVPLQNRVVAHCVYNIQTELGTYSIGRSGIVVCGVPAAECSQDCELVISSAVRESLF